MSVDLARHEGKLNVRGDLIPLLPRLPACLPKVLSRLVICTHC